MDILVWTTVMASYKPVAIVALSETFLHVCCVPTLITFSSGRIVNTRNGRAGAESAQGNGNPPPPPSLAQAIASILESRDEQTELLR
jgi:hypothetical protein